MYLGTATGSWGSRGAHSATLFETQREDLCKPSVFCLACRGRAAERLTQRSHTQIYNFCSAPVASSSDDCYRCVGSDAALKTCVYVLKV